MIDGMLPMPDTERGLPPHVQTFAGMINTHSRIYSFRSDEALANSWQYALDMRQDSFITSKLNKRYLNSCNQLWKIESVSNKYPASEDVIDLVTSGINLIPEYHSFRYSMCDAAWYGKQGTNAVWGDMKSPDGYTINNIVNSTPIMGDKIWFDFDSRPGVMISPLSAGNFPKSDIRHWDRGMLLMLDNRTLSGGQFIFQRHWKEDSDYFDYFGAGKVSGIGIRSKIYWAWFLRNQSLGWMMEYMQRVGTDGIMVFYYEEGNDDAKNRAYENASLVRERNCLVVPRRVEKGSETAAVVDHIPFSSSGVEMLRSLVESYFERHIEAMILGGNLIATQSAAAKDSYNDEFKHDLYHVSLYDAQCYDSAMNRYYIPSFLKRNGLESAIGTVAFRTVVPDPRKIENMARLAKVMSVVELPEDEVTEQLGFRQPRKGEKTVGGLEAIAKANANSGSSAKAGSVSGSDTEGGEGSDNQ